GVDERIVDRFPPVQGADVAVGPVRAEHRVHHAQLGEDGRDRRRGRVVTGVRPPDMHTHGQTHDLLHERPPGHVSTHPLKWAASRAACNEARYPSLVTVAPVTASMVALWAASTSARNCGTAYALISWSRRLPLGTCKAVTSVIFPPVMRTRTWT